ncbi:MAG: nitrite reductase (NO-forming), partial [Haloarculaceae archaeon]
HTFEQTFDSSGVVLYYCAPHRTLGMRGAIIVE